MNEQNLVILRTIGSRRLEAVTLRYLGACHLERGDAEVAFHWYTQAHAVYQAVNEPLEDGENVADTALCQLRLGQPDVALSTVNVLLDRLEGDLKEYPAHKTIELRWSCQQVLAAVGDARAAPLLEQLFAHVQLRADELTDAADRERLIQALPVFRAIVAAYQQRGEAHAAH